MTIPATTWLWGLLLVGCGLLVAFLPLPVVIVLVGGLTALVAIALRPIIGLAITLFVAPFAAWEAVFVGGVFGRFSSGQLVLYLTLAAWLMQGLARREIRVPSTPFNRPILLFVSVMALSLWNAASTWDGLKEIGKWLEIVLVLWLVVDTGRRYWAGDSAEKRNYTRLLVLILLLGAIFQAVMGIWQYGLRGDGPEHFLISDGLYRASGTFQQPNPFGGYISLMLSLAVGTLTGLLVALWFRRHNRKRSPVSSWLWLGFLGITVLLLVGALLSSWSRGAWFNYVAGLVVFVFFLPRKRWHGLLLLVLGGLALLAVGQAGLIPASIYDRLTGFAGDLQLSDVRGVDINDVNFAVIERLAHWQAALGMARDQLWLGVGFGNYEAVYPRFALVNWQAALGHAHNYYLNLLAETGLVGLLAYIGLWLVIVWQTLKLLVLRSWEARGMALGLLAAWTGMAVHHLLDNLYVNNLFLQLGTMLGLLVMLRDRREDEQKAVVE
jgi:O-antigen ligase